MRSCEANEADLLAAILEGKGFQSNPGGASDQFRTPCCSDNDVLMGYSKGAPDILSTLVQSSRQARQQSEMCSDVGRSYWWLVYGRQLL
jgi:hypothetical protein